MNEPEIIDHPIVGEEIEWNFNGECKIRGICDRVERRSADTINVKTNEKIADQSIRFRIKPKDGSQARWTSWFPDKENYQKGK